MPKNGRDGNDDPLVVTTTAPRMSTRATPLAPRPSQVDEIEYETLARISELNRVPADPLGLGARGSVLGYVWADADGTVSECGDGCGGPFADRVHYFAVLARLIGLELGFEALQEIHLTGETHRIVWTARQEGWAAALSTPAERPAELARRLRGEK